MAGDGEGGRGDSVGGEDWVHLALVGKGYVDECCKGLHWYSVLGVIKEVFVAALVFWVPCKYIELGLISLLTAGRCGSWVLEAGEWFLL